MIWRRLEPVSTYQSLSKGYTWKCHNVVTLFFVFYSTIFIEYKESLDIENFISEFSLAFLPNSHEINSIVNVGKERSLDGGI